MVTEFLSGSVADPWQIFKHRYLTLIRRRFQEDRTLFDTLAADAMCSNVYLGCSCPTQRNPDVRQCHTYPALEFMGQSYPDLLVVFPPGWTPTEMG
jgi:hypothetical protein